MTKSSDELYEYIIGINILYEVNMTLPLRKVTATEAIVESLKERIRTGEFGPGDQLPSEQFMLQEYGVSRLTLRESLARLAALGIIKVHHGKGAFVAENISISALDNVLIPLFPHYDASRMQDLIDARNLIESEVVAQVAEIRCDEDIKLLRELLDYNEDILNNPELFAERDYDFHLALVVMAGNQFFIVMYRALYQQIRSFLVQYARSINDRREAMDRHQPILEAIVNQDIEKARQLAKDHAGICASFIKEFVPKEGDKK